MNNKSLANISNVLFLSSINIVIKKTFLVGKDTNNVRKHVLLINLSYDKEVIYYVSFQSHIQRKNVSTANYTAQCYFGWEKTGIISFQNNQPFDNSVANNTISQQAVQNLIN